MVRRLAVLLIIAVTVIAIVAMTRHPSHAALVSGKPAPMFTAQASLAGKTFTFDLAASLKKGPVVVYFYPAAFTQGCTLEAHDFADHMPAFKQLGASVIGVSGDDIEKLTKFSVSECRSAFPVAADKNLAIAKQYDSVILNVYADRVSYVIAPDGTIVYAYKSSDPDKHVANTLEALRKLKSASAVK